MKIQQVKYGILLPDNTLARIQAESNTYTIVDYNDYPEYLVDDPNIIKDVLTSDVRWYNSSYEKPCWGSFKKEDFRPAKITINIEEETNIKPYFLIPMTNILNTFSLFSDLIKKYKIHIDSLDREYVGVIVGNMKKEEIEPAIGQIIYIGDTYMKRELIKVLPLPKDISGNLENGILLVCGEQEYVSS